MPRGPSHLLNALAVSVVLLCPLVVGVPPAAGNGCITAAAGTAADPFLIQNSTNLECLRDNDAYYWNSGYHFKQTSNIFLMGSWAHGIGDDTYTFNGTYDGDGYSIRDLTITDDSQVGLFGVTEGATITDVTLVNATITATDTSFAYVGALVGAARSGTTITDSSVSGSVTSSGMVVGGLVGEAGVGTVIDGSSSTADVTASGLARALVGGLIGRNDPTSGSVTITDSFATGDVSGGGQVGGLIGAVFAPATISRTYATGDVTGSVMGTTYGGGLIGQVTTDDADITSVSESFASGAVSVTNGYAGGLIGGAGDASFTIDAGLDIANSYASGSVTTSCFATCPVGGLLGGTYTAAGKHVTISNSYARGAVTSGGTDPDTAGGLLGQESTTGDATITNSFWNPTDAGPDATEDFGTESTQGAMITVSLYSGAGWDITVGTSNSTEWGKCSARYAGGYPFLQWYATAQGWSCGVPSGLASAYAIIGSIDLTGTGFAGNPYTSADDTVYLPTQGADYLGIVNPGTTSGPLDDSIAVRSVYAAAVGSDDTLYVAQFNDQRIAVFAPGTSTPAYSITSGGYPTQLAVNADDTLVSASRNRSEIVAPGSTTVTTALTGLSPAFIVSAAVDSTGSFAVGNSDGTGKAWLIPSNSVSVATTITGLSGPSDLGFTSDDTLVALGRGGNRVDYIYSGSTTPDRSVSIGEEPVALTVADNGDVFTSNYYDHSVSRIPAGSSSAEKIFTGLNHSHGVTTTSTGLLYATTNDPMGFVSAAEVSASSSPLAGSAGATVTVSLDDLPAGVLMDNSTIETVWWGSDTVPFARTAGSNDVTVTVPGGSGTVNVIVEVNAGVGVTASKALRAGTFTYPALPPPPPTYPPSAPRDVAAVAGDRSVSVLWSAPASSGSYAISSYQVRSSPASPGCLVTELSCEVTGLTNGTAYTFEVRALSGAGWGPWSAASSTVTPGPPPVTIVITGSRTLVQGKAGIVITGSTTGLGMGAILRPWIRFPGQPSYTKGFTSILVDTAGEFTWQRRTVKKIYVSIRTEDGSVKSNRIAIAR